MGLCSVSLQLCMHILDMTYGLGCLTPATFGLPPTSDGIGCTDTLALLPHDEIFGCCTCCGSPDQVIAASSLASEHYTY